MQSLLSLPFSSYASSSASSPLSATCEIVLAFFLSFLAAHFRMYISAALTASYNSCIETWKCPFKIIPFPFIHVICFFIMERILFISYWWMIFCAWNFSVPVANFWIYRWTGLLMVAHVLIVVQSSLLAFWSIVVLGGELLIKTWSKISNSVGVMGRASCVLVGSIVRSTRFGLYGNKLASRHTDSIFWCVQASDRALTYTSIYLIFWIRISWAWLRGERAAVNRFFNGPKIATSSGWSRCDVWAGRIRSRILFWIQQKIKFPLMWLS